MTSSLRVALLLSFAALAGLARPAAAQETWESGIVYEGPDGRLVYASDAEGNRIPDFSHAGYRGGGVPLPDVPVVKTVAPVDGDDTAHLQAALDEVAALAPDENGFRGAVLMAPGTYEVGGTLYLRDGGVVLRGAGDDEDPATNTILHRSGTSRAPVVYAGREDLVSGGEDLIRRVSGRATAAVTDAFVPVGARSFDVDHPERFAPGDAVVVLHPTTVAWLAAVDYGGTAGDPGWAVRQDEIAFARTIERIDGSTVTLDAPVFNHLDKSLSPSYLYHRDVSDVIEEVGVESFRIVIDTEGPSSEDHAENAVVLGLVENAWVQDVTALHFWHAGISVQQSRYVTVRGSRALDPHSLVTGSRRYNFETYRAQLVLFEGNYATGARHAYVGNGETRDSGIVFLDNTSEDAHTSSESHRTWGMGFLYDNHTEVGSSGSSVFDRRIHLGNRGDYGTGHGWACAHCVVWNADMNGSVVVVEKPPTAQNYAIGVQGRVLTNGPFTSNTGAYVEGTNRDGLRPVSLYLRQLDERMTPVAAEPAPEVPAAVARLYPSYPNPFAAATRIAFETAAPGAVRLAVYDVLGREVAVLADGFCAAGRHEVRLDGRGLAPGLYVYRLTVNAAGVSIVRTGRMTRVR